MKVFVGYGYNDRDAWIEEHVFPILRALGFGVVDGRNMHGEVLHEQVAHRIGQADAAIGFFTIREGQDGAAFNSHPWVKDEMVHAAALGKAVILVKEDGVRVPDGLLGPQQHVPLRQNDRLACVAELVVALGHRNMRRLKLEPESDQLRRNLRQWRREPGFVVKYRSQDEEGTESPFRQGRLELIDHGFYLNVTDVPKRALVEVEGCLGNQSTFSSGWVSADAIQVPVF